MDRIEPRYIERFTYTVLLIAALAIACTIESCKGLRPCERARVERSQPKFQ